MIKNISLLVLCAVLIATLTGGASLMSAKASENKPSNSIVDETGPAAAGSSPNETRGVSMRVLWTVSGYVFGNTSTWNEQEAKALLFKPLNITESEIIFDGRTCQGVTFKREMISTAEYLTKTWQVTLQTLGIADQQLQVVKTTCDIPGFQEYMRLSDGRLIVPVKGVFFFFEPTVTR